MGRRAKPAKVEVRAKRLLARKSPDNEGARIRDLEKRLAEALRREAEALEQQTATSDILRAISSSHADVQPIFEAIAENAARLVRAWSVTVLLWDGRFIHLVADRGGPPGSAQLLRDESPWLPNTTSGTGRCIATGTVIHVPDVDLDPEADTAARELARRRGWRSDLNVPMLRKGSPIGAISATRVEAGPFSPAEIGLLQTFADQAVIAIENARLFKELEARNRDLTATSEILRVISISPTDVQPVFGTIAQSAARLCEAFEASIFERDGDHLRLVAHHGPLPDRPDLVIPVIRGTVTGRCVLDRQIVSVADLQAAEDDFPQGVAFAREFGFRSFVSVPLLHEGVAIGAIGVRRTEVQPFTDTQITLLQTFADQAVIAIENVRLFNETKEALEQQTATAEILAVISNSPTNVKPVLDTIAQRAVRLCAGFYSLMFLSDGERLHLAATNNVPAEGLQALEQRYPLPLSSEQAKERLTVRAMSERRVLQVLDMQSEDNPSSASLRTAAAIGHRAVIAVPLIRQTEPIGVLIVSRRDARGFGEKEVALLRAFTDQAVIAIENVRLFKELETRNGALTESLEQQTATSEILRVISSSPKDVQPVFDAIIANAVRLCGGVYGIIWRYDGEVVNLVGSHNLPGESREDLIGQFPRRLDDLYGPLPNALRTGTVVDIPDVERYDDPGGRMRKLWRARGVRSVVMVPIRQESGVAGAISVSHPEVDAFSSERVELLKTFASQAVIAIENVRLFNELEAVNRHLEAASQHKSEFLANMSHELRTPLNAVIGFSEVLSEGMFGQLNEKQEEYARDIYSSGQHLLSLINDILDLSKIEAGRMELEVTDFHLPAALDNALTLVRERAGRRGIALGMTVDDRLGEIRADERKIRQVVLNLLSNAIKFTPEGGRIEVRAAPVDESVEVSVTDTGVGIAPEDQEAIFEEFKQVGTAAKRVEGTGLGLALSRKFIELHGGQISVKSTVGVGSTFTFRIPVHTGV